MEASHHNLDNLVGIIDRNRLQIDSWVTDVMHAGTLAERYRSFGWEVIEVDGHDIQQVVRALQKARSVPMFGKPTLIIASVVSGKGVSFMENVPAWNNRAPNYDEMVKALGELGLKDAIAYDFLLDRTKESRPEIDTVRGIRRVK